MIHYFLQKTKIRIWITLPFLFLSITGLGFVFAHAVSGFIFEIPLIVRIGYIIFNESDLMGNGSKLKNSI
jgi:hypothetical protein